MSADRSLAPLPSTREFCSNTSPTVNNNVAIRRHFAYQRQMPKTPSVGVRLDPEMKAALEKAAAADARSLSSLIAKIVSEWVRENGWLKREGKGKR